MADVQRITAAQRPERGSDCVLIEHSGSGWVGSSVLSRRASDVFYAAEPVEDLQSAIAKAVTWADLNGVPVVYVVEGLSSGPDVAGAP